ncbi:hypothetical protein NEFER03_1017 [Nematocida sp. LUAm3]|nr:hypothetical protein NEFER03_1017 [Nematocida sp. LUAm3]KAI5175379.1 hypothetical protein NEFER02_1308 [Nematocida sp. LUAm2]KAI5177664.1 hypothetical protein NEFER01_0888 [Nematocida sp. LUAm1]
MPHSLNSTQKFGEITIISSANQYSAPMYESELKSMLKKIPLVNIIASRIPSVIHPKSILCSMIIWSILICILLCHNSLMLILRYTRHIQITQSFIDESIVYQKIPLFISMISIYFPLVFIRLYMVKILNQNYIYFIIKNIILLILFAICCIMYLIIFLSAPILDLMILSLDNIYENLVVLSFIYGFFVLTLLFMGLRSAIGWEYMTNHIEASIPYGCVEKSIGKAIILISFGITLYTIFCFGITANNYSKIEKLISSYYESKYSTTPINGLIN